MNEDELQKVISAAWRVVYRELQLDENGVGDMEYAPGLPLLDGMAWHEAVREELARPKAATSIVVVSSH